MAGESASTPHGHGHRPRNALVIPAKAHLARVAGTPGWSQKGQPAVLSSQSGTTIGHYAAFSKAYQTLARTLLQYMAETRAPHDCRATIAGSTIGGSTMGTIGAIISWAVCGLVVGAIARALVPGRQEMSMTMTMVLGVVGALAGGLVAYLVSGQPADPIMHWPGWLMAIVGAIALVVIYTSMGRKSHV